MTDHEVFKLKREVVQYKKIVEQQKLDLRDKNIRLVQLEEENDHLKLEQQSLIAQHMHMDNMIREYEQKKRLDDPYLLEMLEKDNKHAKEQLEYERKRCQELMTQLEGRDANLNNLRSQLQQVAHKYKDDTIVKDELHLREEYQDNRAKINGLVEKSNQMSKQLERLSAENRVLRKMAGVPDDYQFELDDIIQEGQLQVEKYRAQVRTLEEEVEELEEERARLRRKLREQAGGVAVDMVDDDNEGSKRALRQEIQELKQLNSDLQNQISNFKQEHQTSHQNTGMNIQPELLQDLVKQQQEFKEQVMEAMRQAGNQNGIVNSAIQQTSKIQVSQLHSKQQQQNLNGLMHLSVAPNPIAGAFGNYNDIKEGYSQRLNVKIPVDMSKAYGESDVDALQLKYEIAALQLQNMETLKVLQEKEQEYVDLQNEVHQIKEDLTKRCLLVQDELFLRFAKEKEQFKTRYGELELKYKLQQDEVVELKVKNKQYGEFFTEIQRASEESLQAKLAEMAKKTSILDVNLIKLSRKYDSLLEEFKQMKHSYTICDSEFMEREQELLAKVYKLIEWKKSAEDNMKIMLSELRSSVSSEQYRILRQALEQSQAKQANMELRESEYLRKIAILEGLERQVYEKGQKIAFLEEELVDVQMETQVVSKRLEALDKHYAKYQYIYKQLIEFIKMKNLSVAEIFKQFDTDGDGTLGVQEFTEAVKAMGIPVTRDEMEVLFLFVDLDGGGSINYQEFFRKLRRSGVNIRNSDEDLLFNLYRAITTNGKLTIDRAFTIFSEGEAEISKDSMRKVLEEMNIPYDKKGVDYLFKIGDSSGDNKISLAEFKELFENIVKNTILETDKSIGVELDWKYAVMIKFDEAIKSQNLTLLDIFNMIDKDGDQKVSLREFQAMFTEMDVGVPPDDVRTLFECMDRDRSGQIQYNEMLQFLNQSKREQEKIEKIQFIQKRTQEMKDVQDTDNQLKQASSNPQLSTESRLQMKISILEMRDKNSTQRVGLLIEQLSSSQQMIKNLNAKIQEIHKSMEEQNNSFFQARQENVELKEKLNLSIGKDESLKLLKRNQYLNQQVTDLKAALKTYTGLYDTAVLQTKTIKFTLEKVKNDHDTMFNCIKELQSVSEQNMTIGKLYHHLMIARWHEGQTNQKYEKILDDMRKLKTQVESYDATVMEKSNEILQQNKIFSEQVRQYESTITELSMKMLPTINIHRIEEQGQKIREIAELKSEVEKSNNAIRDKFHELQLQADYFESYREKLNNLENQLRSQNPDELSQQIIEVSTKYSEAKMEMLKAQRDVAVAKEKEGYYARLNRQYTDTIKKLEYDLSHSDLAMRKKEEEWRKKFYEQRKIIFDQLGMVDNKDLGQMTKHTSNQAEQLIEAIKQKQVTQIKEQTNIIPQSEVDRLNMQIKDLSDQVKKKDIEIAGYIERIKVGGGNAPFNAAQYQQQTENLLLQEAEKVAQAGQQMMKAMQEMLRDKDAELDRKEQQIDQLKKESMLHKRKDLEEIQRLNDLVHRREQNGQAQQSFIQASLYQDNHMQPVMIENYQKGLEEKDKKIKELDIALQAERKAMKKIKEELVQVLTEKESLQNELHIQIKRNERDSQDQKVETLQKIVNQKNKELQNLKTVVQTLKDELFKISEETINKEQSFKIKENKLNTNSTELEMKLTKMMNDIKALRTELKVKERQIEQIEEKEIAQRAQISELQTKNQELRAIIQAGSGKDEGAQINNISEKLKQFNQMSMQNAQMQKEIQMLKSQGGAKNLFDKDGNLQSQSGLYFKDLQDFLSVFRQYLQSKPKFNLLNEFKKVDKQKTFLIPLASFWEILAMVGIKLRHKDQQMLTETIKNKDNADYFYKFYYPYMQWSDMQSQTDNQEQAPKPVEQQVSQKFSLKSKPQ